MAWRVFSDLVLEYRGQPHRFLQIEVDDELEAQAAEEKSRAKGWDLYAHATDAVSGKPVVLMCKPCAAPPPP